MVKAGQGVLFEPSPLAIASLTENLRDELKANLVEIVPAAVCQQTGSMDFYMEDDAGETSSLIATHSNQSARKITVATTTIDAEFARLNLEFIDFLKIDAEGYDLQVLRGAGNCLREKLIGVIQFEYNAPWTESSSTLASAISYLNGFGYPVYLLKRDGLYEFEYQAYGEYYRYSNFVAIAPGYLTVQPLPL
jgi:FkbM family methyltransferase